MKETSSPIIHPWGKIASRGGEHHHLAHHCADVAACFLALAQLPVWRQRLEQSAGQALSELQIERLAALAFMHDVGKLLPAFQCKGWSDEQKRTLGRSLHRCQEGMGHAQEGACLFLAGYDRPPLDALQQAFHVDEIDGWGNGETVAALLLASLSHHGRRINLDDCSSEQDAACRWRPLGDYDPLIHARHLGRCMKRWFPLAFSEDAEPLPESARFQHLFAGLVALADWIGSDTAFFPYVAEPDDDYFRIARERARKALRAIGLDTAPQEEALRASPLRFDRLLPKATPNPVQRMMGDISVHSRLVILEAQTGAGKTEAALWRFLKLFEAGEVDGLYFALPTRSAAVQLHARIHAAMKRVFGSEAPETILAVPGYYRAGEHQGTPLPHWRVLWDDDDRAGNETLARRWAAEHSKRYLAAQVAVGTVDQAMLAALAVKHAHLRGSALARSLLVVDEVHASDVYMNRILKQLVKDHLSLGGHVLAMSATLGSVLRSEWLETPLPSFREAVETPYPAIWTREERKPATPEGLEKRRREIAMKALPTMEAEAAATQAIAAARAGAKVLVVRNTVRDAVDTFQAVEASLDENERHLLFSVNGRPTLHHGRFAAEDRRLLDAQVEALLGRKGQRPDHGLIVIGTQTLEQSLDICADFLVTDLCPADVLLQRLGRLHRHDNARPKGFEIPRCMVLTPEDGLDVCLKGMVHGLGAWHDRDGTLSGIYVDVVALELTRRLIEQYGVWCIPAMNRLLVETITHPEPREALLEELGPDWQAYDRKLTGMRSGDRLFAGMRVLRRDLPFFEAPTMNDEDIRTRLGEDGVPLDLPEGTIGPFGEPISRLSVPASLVGGLPDEFPADIAPLEEGMLKISLGHKSLIYDTLGLRPEAKDSPA